MSLYGKLSIAFDDRSFTFYHSSVTTRFRLKFKSVLGDFKFNIFFFVTS